MVSIRKRNRDSIAPHQPLMKKTIRLWYLYDFANSFASIVLIFYYPLMLAERGASSSWIGISASISTGILLLILPYLGAHSDRTGRRIYFIKIASLLMVASLFAISFLMQNSSILSTSTLIILSLFYILFQICFQGGFAFYSAMLRSITTSDNNAKVSGIGIGFGQFGNAFALGIISPIIGSSFIIIGLQGKPLALVIGGILFAFISIPFLLQKDLKQDLKEIDFSYKKFAKRIFVNKKILFFLLGYSLLSDAILTFQLYVAIYVKKVFLFSDQLITYAGITGLLFGVLGGFVAGKLASKLKDKQKTLHLSVVLYAICFGICALMPQIPILIFIGLALSGFSYGLVFSLSRTVYSEISPEHEQAEFFSVFTVFEKAASIIGPLVWLLTFYLLRSFGESIQYRGSVLLLLMVCLCGLYFLKKSKALST